VQEKDHNVGVSLPYPMPDYSSSVKLEGIRLKSLLFAEDVVHLRCTLTQVSRLYQGHIAQHSSDGGEGDIFAIGGCSSSGETMEREGNGPTDGGHDCTV
jgi:hypothetical protein